MVHRLLVRSLIVSVAVLMTVGSCSHVVELKQGFSHYILTKNNQPAPALQALLTQEKIEHANTLESVVQATQKSWFRPAGVERFQMVDTYADRKNDFLPYLRTLGMIDEVKPKLKRYTYGMVHGATLPRVRMRFAYLIKLWKEGVRFDQLVFLTGERYLDHDLEHEALVCGCTTETDMMRMIYEQTDMPQELRVLPFLLISAPQQLTEKGTMRRPNTQDTVKEWLKTNPLPGSCLAVSNQPYVAYQDTVMRTDLPEMFILETVGVAVDTREVSVRDCLDSLARWLYQENMRQQAALKPVSH